MKLTDYQVPASASEAEFTEKRSRFIGHVWEVNSEEEARARIAETKARHHDSRHNCWCYLLREAGTERYSDDGEPQGTAGQPMLEVFRREKVTNVCCVVTRYFGGILLGAGGLTRAYARAAKDALDAAGISVVSRWVEVALACPYHLYERIKQEVEGMGGLITDTEYTDSVTLRISLKEGAVEGFGARITELTAGGVALEVTGEAYRGTPRKNES